MHLSETITIYLAIAAPFGVNYFLREHKGKEQRRSRSLLRAASAGLLWPFVAVAAYLSSRSSTITPQPVADEEGNVIDAQTGEKISTAQRQLLAALEKVRALAQACAGQGEELEQSVRAVREGIEKYVGLTLALAGMKLDDAPARREMELCRIAGRAGEDLLLAGRCIHRRNLARLVAHHARSRTELLHACASVREIKGAARGGAHSDTPLARDLSMAVLKFYGQAINLLSLLEDEGATRALARLLDAECARLRQLEAQDSSSGTALRMDGKQARHTYTDWPTLAGR